MEPEVLLGMLKYAAVFFGLSFVVFWIGLVWWVSQDVTSRTTDKIILAAAVAFATIFGPIGVLLYLIVRPRQTIKETYREMLETEINRKLASLDMAYCPFCGAHLEHDVDLAVEATKAADTAAAVVPAQPEAGLAEALAAVSAYDQADAGLSDHMVSHGAKGQAAAVRQSRAAATGKLLSVKISQAVVMAGKTTVKTITMLLAPAPKPKGPRQLSLDSVSAAEAVPAVPVKKVEKAADHQATDQLVESGVVSRTAVKKASATKKKSGVKRGRK